MLEYGNLLLAMKERSRDAEVGLVLNEQGSEQVQPRSSISDVRSPGVNLPTTLHPSEPQHRAKAKQVLSQTRPPQAVAHRAHSAMAARNDHIALGEDGAWKRLE